MKKILAVLLVLAMVIGLAACGGGTTPANNNTAPSNNTTPSNNTEPVAEKKVLKVAFRGDPNGLCHVSIAVASANTPAHELMMDRLFEYDYKTGEPTPMLATGWEQLSDTTYRVTIRDDVYTWAGDKLKASDVLYTIKSVVEGTRGEKDRYFGNFDVANCKVEDDTHIVLALKKVDPFIKTTLSNIPYGILCEESVNKGGGLEKMDGQGGNMPNCYTGPYIPYEWNTGSSIKFKKNENYWDKDNQPYFDEVEIISIADASARTDALEAGNVDLVLEPSEGQVDLIKGKDGLAVFNYGTTNHHTLFTNTQKAPFDDVNVRIACALALNYDANIQVALGGYGKHSDDILPIGNPMYESPSETFYKYDLDLAKEYMAKSKYAGTNPKVEIYYTPQHEAYVPLIQQQWKEIGIEVVPTPIAQAEFYNTMATGEKQAWIVNNSNPNPYEQLKFYDGEHFNYKDLNGGPGWNGGAEVTALYDKITAEPDMEKARPYYQELRKIINAQVPSIPLFVYERLAFATSKLDGLILTEVGDINFSKCKFK